MYATVFMPLRCRGVIFNLLRSQKEKKSIPSNYFKYVKQKGNAALINNIAVLVFSVWIMDMTLFWSFCGTKSPSTCSRVLVFNRRTTLPGDKKYHAVFVKSTFLVFERWDVSVLFCYSKYLYYLLLFNVSFLL